MTSAAAHVVCPHCDAVNRVLAERLADAPNCGACRRPLFTGEPFALTSANSTVHLARNDLPLLVDFWAPWCGPCRMMAPAFAEAARLLEPQARTAKIDTEAEPALDARHGIRSIPTLVLLAGGREIARQSGAMGARDIVTWARGHL